MTKLYSTESLIFKPEDTKKIFFLRGIGMNNKTRIIENINFLQK